MFHARTMFRARVVRRCEISVNSVLSIFTLLAFTKSVDHLFYSLNVLSENEYFLRPMQHCSFTFTSCP